MLLQTGLQSLVSLKTLMPQYYAVLGDSVKEGTDFRRAMQTTEKTSRRSMFHNADGSEQGFGNWHPIKTDLLFHQNTAVQCNEKY